MAGPTGAGAGELRGRLRVGVGGEPRPGDGGTAGGGARLVLGAARLLARSPALVRGHPGAGRLTTYAPAGAAPILCRALRLSAGRVCGGGTTATGEPGSLAGRGGRTDP